MNDLNRTQEDHELICKLVDHNEALTAQLDSLAGLAAKMMDEATHNDFTEGYAVASYHLYQEIKKVFDFAQTLTDY